MEIHPRTEALTDHALPLLPYLLGQEAPGLLQAALGPVGQELTAFAIRQVSWRPGRSLTVEARASVRDQSGREFTETFILATGDEAPAGGAMLLARDGASVAVWRMAADPHLPGLSVAMNPALVGDLLRQLGVEPGPVSLTVRAYRPGRRAVIEVRSGAVRVFMKVVRPAKVEALQVRHRLALGALPVPRSHGWSEAMGIVVLESMPGHTLRDTLENRDLQLPPAHEVLALLQHVPDPGDGIGGSQLRQGARFHRTLLRRLMPELAPRLDRLVKGITSYQPPVPVVPLHGDFYESQLMVRDGRVTGLLDIDTVGPGPLGDDHANFIGHLACWQLASKEPGRVRDYARELLAISDAVVPPPLLRNRIAAAILGLATGPFRVQSPNWPAETEQRIALAEEWLASAENVHKRILTAASRAS